MTLLVGVIGAGPAGLSAAKQAIDLGCKVELIDPWILSQGLSPINNVGNKKTRFGSEKMYKYPNKFIEAPLLNDVPISSVVGGFSTVWGAGLDYDFYKINFDYPEIEVRESEKFVKSIFGDFSGVQYRSERFNKIYCNSQINKSGFQQSRLAINSKKCKLTGNCMNGCSLDAIWSAEKQWENLVQESVILRRGYAVKVNDFIDGAEVLVEDNRVTQLFKYDIVFVACGPIASAALGQRSGILPSALTIGETRIFHTPLLFVNNFYPYNEEKFSLSQLFYFKKLDQQGSFFWMSLFESSRFLQDKAKFRFGKILGLIPQRIWGYIGVGISYIPEEFSGKLKLEFREDKSVLTSSLNDVEIPRYIKAVFTKIRRDFFRSGIVFFHRISMVGNPGSSFHVGHLTFENQEIFDSFGRTSIRSNIAFVDASSLRSLPTGPILAIAMINASLKVKKMVEARMLKK
jgi:hypothetical protein